MVLGTTMITVAEAARRAHRSPETLRRWIREGALPARKIGRRHLIDEADLQMRLATPRGTVPQPREWRETFWGGPMPDCVRLVRRSRSEHWITPAEGRDKGLGG